MTLAAGARLGSYEIINLLGAGGMGEVYRARDTRLGRDVAIKVLPGAFSADADRLARFEREARVLASLNHPHIATIHGIEEGPSTGSGQAPVRALVLELVDGETLADRIARGPLPASQAIALARQIADALDAAHERGIVHRDLKPANIKITPDGRVKVLDFGLARLSEVGAGFSRPDVTDAPTALATEAGLVLGTAPYMSPEQARGLPVDKRADIWAFGCVLYEMLTGRRAFGGSTTSDTIAAILEREPDWAAIPGSVSRPARHLLGVCLAKDPALRLRDIGDVRAILESVPEHDGIAADPRTTARRAASWVAAALVGAALAAAFAWQWAPAVQAPRRLSILPPAGTTFTARDITGHPQFALSPDGTMLTFVAARRGEVPLLWVQSLESAAVRPLPGTDNASGPFWAPDSRSVAFFARGKLKTVSVDGASSRDLADVTVDVTSGTWNADGVILFGGATAGGLSRVPADGGTPVAATTLDAGRGESGHRWPGFLPDGRRYVFFVRSSMPANTGIYIGSLDSPEKRLIVETFASGTYADPGQLLFERNGTLTRQRFDPSSGQRVGEPVAVGDQILGFRGPSYLPISAASDGTLAYWTGPPTPTRLEWFDREGRSLGIIPTSARTDAPQISPDGRRLVFTARTTSNVNNLVTVDLADGVASRVAFATIGAGIARFAIWAPDSQRIVFSTIDAGGSRILQKAVSGAGPETPVVEGPAQWAIFPDDWSRDGRWLLYAITAPSGWDTWRLDVPSGRARALLAGAGNEVQARTSPDGRWVAYASDETGAWNVYVQPFPEGAGRWLVSPEGGVEPAWSADGRELFYVDAAGRIATVPIRGGEGFQYGAPRPLFAARIPAMLAPFRSGYAVTPDGQRFLLNVVQPDSDPSAITVVLNQRWE